MVKPTAVLIDPGVIRSIEEFLLDYPMPLLSMGSRPLLAHWLSVLSAAGISDVIIMLEHLPEVTRDWLRGAFPAGMNISCVNIRKGQPYKSQFSHLMDVENSFIFPLELRAFPTNGLIEILQSIKLSEGVVSIDGLSGWAQRLANHFNLPLQLLSADEIVPINLPRDVWQINMDILSGKLSDNTPVGYPIEKGCYVASHCKIASSVRYLAPMVIGERCIFTSNVQVGPSVVAGEQCVFDEGSFVEQSVVLGRTFIGQDTVVRRALVSGTRVYLVDEDRVLHVNDVNLLSRISDKKDNVGLAEKGGAAITLLILALPLILFSLLALLRGKSIAQAEDIYLESGWDLNGFRVFRNLSVLSLNVAHPMWNKVLWLLEVLRGHISLVGTSVRATEGFEYPCWVTDAEVFHPGVITLADITLDDGASDEEVVIADAYQLARGEVGFHLGLWARWMRRLLSNIN